MSQSCRPGDEEVKREKREGVTLAEGMGDYLPVSLPRQIDWSSLPFWDVSCHKSLFLSTSQARSEANSINHRN